MFLLSAYFFWDDLGEWLYFMMNSVQRNTGCELGLYFPARLNQFIQINISNFNLTFNHLLLSGFRKLTFNVSLTKSLKI